MNISKINIRTATVDDLDEIYLFERGYMEEYEPNQLARWETVKDKTMELLRNNITNMFVATVDDHIAGHVYWSILDGYPCIFSIYISKDYRRMGLASRLMHTAEEHVYDNGYSKLTLSTLVNNTAQHLFDRLGYERTSVTDGWINYIKVM